MKIALTFVTCALFAGLCSGCASDDITKESFTQIMRSGSRNIQAEAQADNYVIRQGDQIQISVWGYPEFNATGNVKEGGSIAIPLIGELSAAGLTKLQFSNNLRQKLAEYIQGEVKLTVTVSSGVAQKVAILGAVSRQETYTITNDVSLLEILSTAGGTTPESDLRHIKILRRGATREPVEVDLTSYIENGNIEALPLIRPGDTVFVPKKGNVVRELSDFMRDAIFIFGFFRVFN